MGVEMEKKRHKSHATLPALPRVMLALASVGGISAGPLLIDHNDTEISALTEAEINRSRSTLHIAYGHTSHGSQLTTGMTGLVDHWDDANNKAANQVIRDYCQANSKVLYDFADIESYDPDGTFFEFPSDNCDYYSPNGVLLGNWASEWQAAHTENVQTDQPGTGGSMLMADAAVDSNELACCFYRVMVGPINR